MIRDQFEEWKQKKIEGSKQRVKEIGDWLRSAHVIKPPFDSDILFRARRRMLAERPVDQEKRPEADCCIIESLAKFFVGREDGDQLLFCTENSQDFAVEVNNKLSLHTVMKPGLPPTEVFTNLASLVAFLKGNKAVEEPAPEEVKEAVEREKSKEIEREIEEGPLPGDTLAAVQQSSRDYLRRPLSLSEIARLLGIERPVLSPEQFDRLFGKRPVLSPEQIDWLFGKEKQRTEPQSGEDLAHDQMRPPEATIDPQGKPPG